MLQQLKIENVAVIESADIVFNEGFNVLTGETGAGKSIVIDSINAVLGERTSRDLIRTGCKKASVSAVFAVSNPDVQPILEQMGVEAEEDGMLMVSRTIMSDGKNICRVGGVPVTVGMLRALGTELVNIHGQHDSQKLLNSDTHIYFIDALAENQNVLDEFRQAFALWKKNRKQLKLLLSSDDEKKQRLDFLEFRIKEIEEAKLVPGEMEELRKKRDHFRNSEKISGAVNSAYEFISGSEQSDGALTELQEAVTSLTSASELDEDIDGCVGMLSDVVYQLEDILSRLEKVKNNADIDSDQIQAIEERLDTVHRLSKKYGGDEEAVLSLYRSYCEERDNIQYSEEKIGQLNKEGLVLRQRVLELSQKLTESRLKAAEEFSEKVCAELAYLDMPGVKFTVDRSECKISDMGMDKIEFLISANEGEAPKPLSKTASGGELSRTMLSIKNVLSLKDKVETLIFDEVDAGISGRAAVKLGKKLHEVSEGRQVICVTHLAQIAARADSHYEITKQAHGGKTFTQVSELDREGRKRELARILGGEEITDAQLRLAEELLNNN